MSKRGATLIETVISIFVVSVVVVTLLEALNVGITGTLNLSRKTSALNLAKSQMEYVKAQAYNPSAGNLSDVYGPLITTGSNISDKVNYSISGQVSNVSANQSLQLVTINVSYLTGKQVQLKGYKAAKESLSSPPANGNIVSDVIEDMPFTGSGGWALGCLDFWGIPIFDNGSCGTYTGYYQVFTTSQLANISATWNFSFVNEAYGRMGGWFNLSHLGYYTWGAPYIGIYADTPEWVNKDSEGNIEKDGVIFRGGLPSPGGGCMPGCGCDIPDAYNEPIIMEPTDCATPTCWGTLFDDRNNWNYEKSNPGCLYWFTETQYGSYEFTVTTPTAQPPGKYTVLFFNGEDRLTLNTRSATVTYVY